MPFYEEDLISAKLTARSIALHDVSRIFSKVHFVWVSSKAIRLYQDSIKEMQDALQATHEVQIHDYGMGSWWAHESPGWYAQQSAKLEIPAVYVHTPYAVILDTKNTFMRDFGMEDFFDKCGLAAQEPPLAIWQNPVHGNWWNKSVEYVAGNRLGGKLEEFLVNTRVGASKTPQIFHTGILKNLLRCIPIHDALHKGATEFMLYQAFQKLSFNGLLKGGMCVNSPTQTVTGYVLYDIKKDGWQDGCGYIENLMLKNKEMPLMLGYHHGVFSNMPKDFVHKCIKNLLTVYRTSRLRFTGDEAVEFERSALDPPPWHVTF